MKIKRLFCLLLVMILLVTSISILPSDKKISAKENSYAVHVYNTLGNLGSGNETVAELIARGEKNEYSALGKIKLDGESAFITSLSKYVVYDDEYTPISIDSIGESYQKYLKAAVYYCNDIYADYNLSKDARYILSQVLVLRIMQLRSYEVPATYQNIISSDYNSCGRSFKDVISDIAKLSNKVSINSTVAWNEVKNVLQRVNNNDSLILDSTTLYLYKSSDENNSPIISGYVENSQSAYIKIVTQTDQDNVNLEGIKYEITQIYDGLYEQVAILTTNEDGVAMTSKETASKLMPNHTYYVKMIKKVDGIVNDTARRTVYTNSNGKLATITFNLKVASCYYNVETADYNKNSTKLEGAEYTVKEWSVSEKKYVDIKKETVKYDISGPMVISSASNGYCQSPLLYYTDSNRGMFQITEREAASGYMKSYFCSVNSCKNSLNNAFTLHYKSKQEYAQILFKTSMSDGSTPKSMSVVYGFYSDAECKNEICTVRTNDKGEGTTLQNDLSFGTDGTVTVYMKYKYSTYGNIEPSNFEVKEITLTKQRGIIRLSEDENVLKFKEVATTPSDGLYDTVAGQMPVVLRFKDFIEGYIPFDVILFKKLDDGTYEKETYTELDAEGKSFEATRIKEYTLRNQNDIYIGHVPYDITGNTTYSFNMVVGDAVNHWEKPGNTISLKISSTNVYKGEDYRINIAKNETAYDVGYNLTANNKRKVNVGKQVFSSSISYLEFTIDTMRPYTTVATGDSKYSGIIWETDGDENNALVKYALVKAAEDVEDTGVIVTDKNGNETLKPGNGYISSDEIIAEWSGTDNVTFPNLIEGEKYRVIVLDAPESFYDNNLSVEFTEKGCSLFDQVNPQSVAMKFTRTTVSIRKFDIDENLLMDSVFELYDSKGVLVDTWRAGDSTDIFNSNNENHTIDYLHVGEKYTLYEISAADGYLKNEPYEFVVNNQTGNQQITVYATGTRYALRWQNESIEADSTSRIGGDCSVTDDKGTVVKSSSKNSGSTLYFNGLVSGLEYKVNQVTVGTKIVPNTEPFLLKVGQNLDRADSNKISDKVDESVLGTDTGYGEEVLEDIETIDTFKRSYSTSTDKTTVYSVVNEDEVPSEGLLSAFVQPITIKSEPTNVVVKKTSVEDRKFLNGTGITINDGDGKYIKEIITSNIIAAVISNPSKLTFIESQAPVGYSYADNVNMVLGDSSKAVVDLQDALNNVKANVINSASLLIEGAEFQIIDENGEVVDEWVSDGTTHNMQNVTSGKVYTIHQTKSAPGYKKAEDTTFMVGVDDSNIAYVPGNYFKPLKIYWAITDTGPVYSTLFANPNEYYMGRAKYNDCTMVYTTTSDTDNSIAQYVVDNIEIRTVRYSFKDRTYVLSYYLVPKDINSSFQIRIDKIKTNGYGVNVQDNYYPYIGDGSKVFSISRPVYEDYFFEIGGKEEDIDATYTLNQSYNVLASEIYQQFRNNEIEQSNSTIWSDMIARFGYEAVTITSLVYMDALEHGTMTAEKINILTAGIDYKVLGSDSTVTILNEQTKLTVNKLDPKGKRLSGAEFEIIDENEEVVKTFTTTDKATVIDGLAVGTYVVHEVSAPEGFDLADDVSVTIAEEEDAVVTIVDNYNYLNLPLAGKIKKSYLYIILVLLIMGVGAAVVIKKKGKNTERREVKEDA